MKNKLYPPEIIMFILSLILIGGIILSISSMKNDIDNYQTKTLKQERRCQ